MKTKKDTKKSLPEPTYTNLESFDSWVEEVVTSPKSEHEPFCPFGSNTFKYGYCDCAYTGECYRCRFSKEAYYQHLMDKYWDGLPYIGI